MPRLVELKDVLFDVGTRPLFTKIGDREVPVRDSLAIVEVKTGRVVSVVGRNYRLVSHREALSLAYECVKAAFPETRDSEWGVAIVDAPATGGACFIDLTHNSTALDFSELAAKDKPEVYGPFVRVTNSYNRTRALAFDIGYYRKVCKNGLILRDSLIRFKMNHQRREIGAEVKFEISQDKLAKQKQDFQAFLDRLKACAVPEAEITGVACVVLGFHAPKGPTAPDDPRLVAWQALVKLVDEASSRYV